MNFGQAFEAMKEGKLVARSGWNGKGMFVFLVPGSTFVVNRPPLLGIFPAGTEINYRRHIDVRDEEGMIGPWVASQLDLQSDDWSIVDG